MKETWRMVATLGLGYFALFGVSNVYYLLPQYLSHAGVGSSQQVGWIVGAFYMATTFSRPFGGGLVRRMGFRRLFRWGGLLGIAGALGFALVGSYTPGLLLFRVILGVSQTLFVVGFTTYQGLVIPESSRGVAFSAISAGGILPLMTLVPLGDLFLQRGYDVAYLLVPLAAALGVFYLGERLPEQSLRGRGREGSLVGVLRNPSLRLLCLSSFCFSLGDACLVVLASLAQSRGVLVSAFFMANASVAAGIRLFGARLLDRLPRRHLAAPAMAGLALALLGCTWATGNGAMAFWGGVFGVAMGWGFPLHMALIADLATPEERPHASAMVWFAMGGSFALVPILMGYGVDWLGAVGSFRGFAGFLLLLSLGLGVLWERDLRRHPGRPVPTGS